MKLIGLGSLFGVSSCKAQETNSVQHSNFTIQRTIQTEKETGSVQNKTYETSSYLIEYKVLYKGKKMKFPAALQSEGRYNYPWRIYILKDAVSPSLLAGSHNMFLITEENNKPDIVRLNHHDAKFGSIQWLDSRDGQPDDEKQIVDPQNDNMLDSSLVLDGGRYLLINPFTVLDVVTLTRHSFNKNKIFEYAGFTLALDRAVGYETAVGFSNHFKQVVFRALKLDYAVEGRYIPALITFNYTSDSVHIVPFSRTDLRLENLDNIDPAWVNHFFEWDKNGKLGLKPNVQAPSWSGKLNFVDKDFINYTLYPAKESLVPIFVNFLESKYQTSDNNISIVDETDKQSIEVRYKAEIAGKQFLLTYDKKDMKLTFNTHFNSTHSDSHRDIIIAVANGFNNELSNQKHQEHFGRYKGD